MKIRMLKSVIFLTVLAVLFVCSPVSAENIDDEHRYAFGENVGWLVFIPWEGPVGVEVDDNAIRGFVWGPNLGWIWLNPPQGGVVHDAHGNLSGYAWGKNIGWINFGCQTNDKCKDNGGVDWGVHVDTTTGYVYGHAWGEGIGWIKFHHGIVDDAAPPEDWEMSVDWRMDGDVSSTGELTLADAILTLQIVSGFTPSVGVHAGADVDGDERIGVGETAYVLQRLAGLRPE